jgi:hypothetical protein
MSEGVGVPSCACTTGNADSPGPVDHASSTDAAINDSPMMLPAPHRQDGQAIRVLSIMAVPPFLVSSYRFPKVAVPALPPNRSRLLGRDPHQVSVTASEITHSQLMFILLVGASGTFVNVFCEDILKEALPVGTDRNRGKGRRQDASVSGPK